MIKKYELAQIRARVIISENPVVKYTYPGGGNKNFGPSLFDPEGTVIRKNGEQEHNLLNRMYRLFQNNSLVR